MRKLSIKTQKKLIIGLYATIIALMPITVLTLAEVTPALGVIAAFSVIFPLEKACKHLEKLKQIKNPQKKPYGIIIRKGNSTCLEKKYGSGYLQGPTFQYIPPVPETDINPAYKKQAETGRRLSLTIPFGRRG